MEVEVANHMRMGTGATEAAAQEKRKFTVNSHEATHTRGVIQKPFWC